MWYWLQENNCQFWALSSDGVSPFWQKHKLRIEVLSNAKSFPQGGRKPIVGSFLQHLWFFCSAHWGDEEAHQCPLGHSHAPPFWCSSLVRAKCLEANVVVRNVAPVPLRLIRQSLVASQNRSGYSPPTMFNSLRSQGIWLQRCWIRMLIDWGQVAKGLRSSAWDTFQQSNSIYES